MTTTEVNTPMSGGSTPSNAVYGSDYMVEVLRALGVRYIALNPGASYRGLHDSIVNFGSGGPEMVLCTHEEIAVAIANGYFRVTGEPIATGLHNVVGLQHASMAIFNAWCDRSAILNLGGGGPQDANQRRSTDWVHTALIQGNAVRDYVKFDDQPASIEAMPESLLRAMRTAMTDPKGPRLHLPRQHYPGTAHGRGAARSGRIALPPARAARAEPGRAGAGRRSARRSVVAGDGRRRGGAQPCGAARCRRAS